MICDYLIVGAGLYGCVLAERLANDYQKSVLLVDKRNHIGGNCYSAVEKESGIEYHAYGTHIFHTSSLKAWEYIRRFTDFNGYFHQVLTKYQDRVYQMPINLETINHFYQRNLTPTEAKNFIQQQALKENIVVPTNLEEQAISLVGRALYEAFIKGYTQKHWGVDPKQLPAKIIARLPIRFNYHEAYFKNARWQGIPLHGYTAIFEKMLASSRIDVRLNCDYFKYRDEFKVKEKTIYTGPIDRFFDYQFGRLNFRSVRFEQTMEYVEDFQGTSVMNYSELDIPYTRIHEPRHLHPERIYPQDKTLLMYEYSCYQPQEPFYPMNTDQNQTIYQRYRALANQKEDLIIGGRLGDFAYYDMDQTILAALKCYEEKILKKEVSRV